MVWLCLPPAFILVACSAYYLTLKMDAICSSETAVAFQRTTRCYIQEDNALQSSNDFFKFTLQRIKLRLILVSLSITKFMKQ
jgi:hypothetical protein